VSKSVHLDRLPKDDDELWWTVKALWNVVIPRTRVCPDHVAPFEVFADAYFRRGGSTALWHGSRGLSGKSFMLSILGLTEAYLKGSDVNLLGGSLAQSANIHQHMRMAMDSPNAPRYMVETEANTLIKLSNGARIRPLTASQRTVRGPHPPFLILDEIDEMDIDILNAALGQPMPQINYLGERIDPYTVMCSTWQYPDGTFTEVRRRFEERDLPIKTWCYRESANEVDGWLSQETIEGKRREIPAEMWRVEYELGEPSIGNRAFDSESVEAMFSLPFAPIEKKEQKDFEYYVCEKPMPGASYVVGADWAKEKDYTVISVWRWDDPGPPVRLVKYIRVNRRPYPFMIKMFNDCIAEYRAEAIHDGTGLGNVVADLVDIRASAFVMTGAKRSDMLSNYIGGVEDRKILCPRIPSAYLAHKYARVGDIYKTGMDFHLPDEVSSFSLAWRTLRKSVGWAGPMDIKKTPEPNKYEKMFDMPQTQEQEQLLESVVYVKDDPVDLSFMV
jgi:hypothetical protein